MTNADSDSPRPFKEVLIVNNPIQLGVVDKSTFDALISDGAWIPIVLASLRATIERHFFPLCELNWDYLRGEEFAPENYERVKMIFHTGLNDEERAFVSKVAEEIESDLISAGRAALDSRRATEEE